MWLADNRFRALKQGRGGGTALLSHISSVPSHGGSGVNYCNPPGGLNSNLNGLDVYKFLVLICL